MVIVFEIKLMDIHQTQQYDSIYKTYVNCQQLNEFESGKANKINFLLDQKGSSIIIYQTRDITLGFFFLENVDFLSVIQASSPSSISNASLTVPNPTFLDEVP